MTSTTGLPAVTVPGSSCTDEIGQFGVGGSCCSITLIFAESSGLRADMAVVVSGKSGVGHRPIPDNREGFPLTAGSPPGMEHASDSSGLINKEMTLYKTRGEPQGLAGHGGRLPFFPRQKLGCEVSTNRRSSPYQKCLYVRLGMCLED